MPFIFAGGLKKEIFRDPVETEEYYQERLSFIVKELERGDNVPTLIALSYVHADKIVYGAIPNFYLRK